jgi:hypothetical protein
MDAEVQRARALVLQVERENQRLEQERLALLQELRRGVVARADGNATFLYVVQRYAT